MKKKILVTLMAAAMTVCMSIPAFAGQWLSDASGWWWQNNDGSYPANTWQWIDGNNDGIAECYYFNENGYCLMNTTTPDGNLVNPVGAWIVDGVIQQQAVETTPTSTTSNSANAVNILNLTPVSQLCFQEVNNVKTSRDELWSKAFQLRPANNSEGGYVEYYIGKLYGTLSFTYAPKEGMDKSVETQVYVYGDDDDLLWESDTIDYKSKSENAIVDISGQDYIKFYIDEISDYSVPFVLFKNVQVY